MKNAVLAEPVDSLDTGITVEGQKGEVTTLSRPPRMVARSISVAATLGDILITTKRLAEKLGVTHGALLIHTSHPLLRPYRIQRGQHTYWGNARMIAKLSSEAAGKEVVHA